MNKLPSCLLKHPIGDYQTKRLKALTADYLKETGGDTAKAQMMAAEDILNELNDERRDIVAQITAAGGDVSALEAPEADTEEQVFQKKLDRVMSFLKDSPLPDSAKQAIVSEERMQDTNSKNDAHLTDATWEKKTISIASLRDKNASLWNGKFSHRGSMTKGPIVLNRDGEIIDGNNRTFEAIRKGDTSIEAYVPGDAAAFNLTTQTEESRRAAEAETAAAEKKAADATKTKADKAQADRERGEFTLTGSNRPADVAMAGGQKDLLAAPRAPTPPAAVSATNEEQQKWWDNELTAAGRRQVIDRSGAKGWPDKTLWRYLSDGAREKFWALRDTVDMGGTATSAPSTVTAVTKTAPAPYHRFTNGPAANKDGVPWLMFGNNKDDVSHYGKDHYTFDPDELDSASVVESDDPAFEEALKTALEKNDEWSGDAESLVEEASPQNIVDSAGLWDNPELVQFVWDNVLDPHGWHAVITPNGAIVFDETVVRKSVKAASLRIEPVNDRLIIVRGDTQANKDRIKAIGGAVWDKNREGWTFKKENEAKVTAALSDLLGVNLGEQEATDGQELNAAQKSIPAEDAGSDRQAGAGSQRSGGSVDVGMAQADAGTRSERTAAAGADRAGGEGARSEGVGTRESVDGRDRDAADGRLDRRAAGIVDEPAEDHTISDGDSIGEGTDKAKARGNIAAIQLVKDLQSADRQATNSERLTLSRYVGWGGLKNAFSDRPEWSKENAQLRELLTPEEYKAAQASILDAHYTSPEVIKAMWDVATHIGFTGGRVLEPSMGVGHFFGLMPAETRSMSSLNGVELDNITGMIAKQLYQKADIASPSGFEAAKIAPDSQDLVIGNPPFGQQPVFDKNMPAETRDFSIHNFFFAKALHVTRPGGIVQMVVSHSLMDARGSKAREWMAARAHLRGAVRLPFTAFKSNAGTEVVTDILVFQKAMPGETPDTAWTKVEDVTLTAADGLPRTFQISQYFKDRPEMILGIQQATGKMYGRPDGYNVAPFAGNTQLQTQIAEKLSKAIPAGTYVPLTKPVDMAILRDAIVPEGVRVYGYYMDGIKVMQRLPDGFNEKREAKPVDFGDAKAPLRAAGMVKVKEDLRALMRAEMTEASTPSQLEKLRAELNKSYEGFKRDFGFINAPSNRRAFQDDPDLPLLESLEPKYDPGISKDVAKKRNVEAKSPSAKKADIFTKRVLSPTVEAKGATNAKDALVASLNQFGSINPDYMVELYGKPWEQISAELGNLIYANPEAGWETADAYLSGNVKNKLKVAREAAKKNQDLQRNVVALEAVQPADLPALKISVRLGTAWVPTSDIEAFTSSLLGGSSRATYVRTLGRWGLSNSSTDTAAKQARWGTPRMDAVQIMVATMNSQQIIIKDNVGSAKEPVYVVNEGATEAARAKSADMAAKFKEWIWEDESRRNRLERIYNDGYNTDIERQYDGSHLTLPGSLHAASIAQGLKETDPGALILRGHQKSAIWRAIQSRVLLLDHVVGAGKTYTLAGTALELRRLGLARKPMLTVPNHLVRQWRDEIYKLYPNANVLATTEQDFQKANRKRLFAKIATGDWDAVIVGHSAFGMVESPLAMQKEILDDQTAEITDAIEAVKRERGDKNVLRDMERIKKTLDAKIKALAARNKNDDFLDFEEMGVDALFVDEAHLFKNLFYMSQMRGVAGLGNPEGSGRAFDLFVKTQYLQRKFGGKAAIGFATGTPISNSLVEMYTMQRYLAYGELKRRGIAALDAWASTYGDVQNIYEVHPSGTGYRLKTRFAKFVNLPSLMDFYRSFADVVSLDDLKEQAKKIGKRFPVPKIKGGKPRNVIADRSDYQTEFFGMPTFGRDESGNILFKHPVDLTVEAKGDGKFYVYGDQGKTQQGGPFDSMSEAEENREAMLRLPVVGWNKDSILWKFENLRQLNKDSNGKINALSVTNEARKAGLDYRLVNPGAPDFAGSKINHAVQDMVRIYHAWAADKGTQLVFCDLSTPKSARNSTKERTAYVRDGEGQIKQVKATSISIEGLPSALLIVREKAQNFVAYDGISGMPLNLRGMSRDHVRDLLVKRTEAGTQWLDMARRGAEPISDEEIADWKASQPESEDEDEEGISISDLLAMGGTGKFSVYDDIKAKLIAAGLPEKEIAFIHDFDTAAKKAELFRKVNSGDVRIVLGSTEKMGAGTNVQERLVAEHHMDAPWRPSDLEQREGRIIRQGNKLYERDPDGFEVEINRYATKQTYDTRMWQLIEHKAAGIEQLRKADRSLLEIDDVGGEEANAADMKAAASGNPLILDEIKLRNEVKSLEAQQMGHQQTKHAMQSKIKANIDLGPLVQRNAAKRAPFIKAAKDNPRGEEAAVILKGKPVSDKDRITSALTLAFISAGRETRYGAEHVPGQYRGLDLFFSYEFGGSVHTGVRLGDEDLEINIYGKDDKFSAMGFLTRVDNTLDNLDRANEREMREFEDGLKQNKGMQAEANIPFAKTDELAEKRTQHRQVVTKLAKAGGGIAITPAMKKELNQALIARGIQPEEGSKLQPRTKTKREATGITPASARSIAADAFGASSVRQLEQSGVLAFVNTADLPAEELAYVRQHDAEGGQQVVALANKTDGKTYVLTDRARASEIPALIMHEVGEHYGMERMLGAEEYARVLEQVGAIHEKGDSDVLNAAWDYVATHYGDLPTTSREFRSETLAVLAEDQQFWNMPLWRRILSKIRQWLFSKGFTKTLRDEDLSRMVQSALRAAMRPGAIAVNTGVQFQRAVRPAPAQPAPFMGMPPAQAAAAPPALPTTAPLPLKGGATGNNASWNAPDMTKMGDLVYHLQNKQVDTKEVIKAIRENGAAISDTWDVELKETLYAGRAAARIEDFQENELEPMLEQMSKLKMSIEDLEMYLHARHAPEANAKIASINPALPDGGSGMTNVDAAQHMASLTPNQKADLAAIAKMVDFMVSGTRQTLVRYGLESQNTIDTWENAYQHYVPLMREDMEGAPGIGQGFSVKGSASKRRTGSTLSVVDILANIATARETAIVRGEKNRIAVALFGLAHIHKNPDFWSTERLPTITIINPKSGLVEKMVDPRYKSADNVVMLRRPMASSGEIAEYAVVFNKRNERAMRMAIALKNLDAEQLGLVMGVVAKGTRWFASVNTQYNPIFGLVNVIRDISEGALNLSSTELSGMQFMVAQETAKLLGEIVKSGFRMDKVSPTTVALWKDFQFMGGKTGFRQMFSTSDERGRDIQRLLKKNDQGPLRNAGDAVLEWLSDYNEALENVTRLAAYKVGVTQGISRPKAAAIAKNMTVNFNRKGASTAQVSALYAFFNAAVQGTSRMIETLKGPAGKQIIVGGVLVGVLQAIALAAAGFDEDDPPEFLRENNLIFPIGSEKYVSIPMPLGFKFLPNFGRHLAQIAINQGKGASAHIIDAIGSIFDTFNPLGSSTITQMLAPTVVDPIAALSQNKDWTGKPIYREDRSGLDPTPSYLLTRDTASWVSKVMSEAMYDLSEKLDVGDKLPILQPTPDQIDYLIGQVTGGVGRELSKTQQTASALFTDADLPTYKIPLAGRFYGKAGGAPAVTDRYYRNIKAINTDYNRMQILAQARKPVGDFIEEHPLVKLNDLASSTSKALADIKKEKRARQLDNAPTAKIKELDAISEKIMRGLNAQVEKLAED